MNRARAQLLTLRTATLGRGSCLEHEVKGMLAKLGLPVPRGCFITTGRPLPEPLGLEFPLVAKVTAPGLAGKSDVGGVRIAIRDGADLYRSVAELSAIPGAVGVLVEEMAPPGLEVIVGGSRDPQFGPIVMFGLGGILVELYRDVAFGLAPLTEEDALRLVRQPKGAQLLDRFRGRPALDMPALVRIMVAVSEIMATGMVEEIDLNPVTLYPAGAIVLDAKLRFRDTPEVAHNPTKEEENMATWKCTTCGYTKEGRCKPQKCPQCQSKGNFEKAE
nr:acetate--CoA ligase family protein [Geomobilimonas luticola]